MHFTTTECFHFRASFACIRIGKFGLIVCDAQGMKISSSLTSFSFGFLKKPPSVYFIIRMTSTNNHANDVIRIIRQVLVRIFPRNILE